MDSDKYYIPNPNGATLVDKSWGFSSDDITTVKNILSRGCIGDLVQVRRRGKSWGHTMILGNIDSNGIYIFDCNSDGKCGVKYYYQTWDTFASKNIGMSMYHSTRYPSGNNPVTTFTEDASYFTPATVYPAATSGTITVYNSDLTAYPKTDRNIGFNDECTINAFYTNGYCSVTYPTKSGSHTEYAKISDFIPNGVTPYSWSPSEVLSTYEKDGAWVRIQDYSTTKSCTWTPTEAGKYNVFCDIKDTSGSVAVCKRITFTITEKCTITASKTNASVGDTITFTATGGLSYKFYYEKDGAWVRIQSFSTSNTCNWKPTAAGDYVVYVDVNDANGNLIGCKGVRCVVG